MNKAKILKAAKLSLADESISKLPQAYETQLGSMFDSGVDLSVGEWQKIALARAFFRSSDLLVLDEPTASLDAASETQFLARMRTATEGAAVLIISHSLSVIEATDEVVYLEGGEVEAIGPHVDLLANERRYSQFVLARSSSQTL